MEIEDRFGTSSTFTLTDEERQALIDLDVTGAESITGVNFYQNDFDTRTTGLDAIVSQLWNLNNGSLNVVLAYNYNKTEVVGGDVAQNETQRTLFEDRLPTNSANLSATYSAGDWSYNGRIRYYGAWTDSSGNSDGDIFQEFGAEAFVDIGVTWQVSGTVKLSANIENLFDAYPDEATYQASRGLIYSRNAPYDTDGGSYSLRIDASF